VGKVCLCNALLANIGLEQVRADGYVEPPLITLGDDNSFIKALVEDKGGEYGVKDAIEYIRQKIGDIL